MIIIPFRQAAVKEIPLTFSLCWRRRKGRRPEQKDRCQDFPPDTGLSKAYAIDACLFTEEAWLLNQLHFSMEICFSDALFHTADIFDIVKLLLKVTDK